MHASDSYYRCERVYEALERECAYEQLREYKMVSVFENVHETSKNRQ